jgi:hypothetical protein
MEASIIDQCSEMALRISNSQDISVKDCKFSNQKTYDNFLSINQSSKIEFLGCKITGNTFGSDFIDVNNGSSVIFSNCDISGNSNPNTGIKSYTYCFVCTNKYIKADPCKLVFKNCTINNNKSDYLAADKNQVDFQDCIMTGNTFK